MAVAEFLGVFGIVFLGCGYVVVVSTTYGLIGIALAFGLVVAAMVVCFGKISGAQINPAVTFMLWATGRVPHRMAGTFLVAQLLGGIAGAAALKGLADPVRWQAAAGGTTGLRAGLGSGTGFAVEFGLTFLLVASIFVVAMHPRRGKYGALAVGAVVALDVMLGAPLTGASMNPARTVGPALVHGVWTDHWVYWAGPLLGAVAAAWVFGSTTPVEPEAG
ncbi:MAG: aquaporin [Planctomycetota bacterium]|nr:aquaporin [Planctomycetota bacterium]